MGDEEQKEVQKDAAQVAQEEYDAAWDGKKAEGDAKDKETTEGTKEPEASEKSEAEKKDAAEQKSKEHGSIASMEKALKDTKASLTKAEQRLKDLETKASDTAKETEKKVDAATAALEDLEKNRDKILEDYPELKPVIDAQIVSAKKLAEELKAMTATNEKKAKEDKEKEKRTAEKDAFDQNVKPHIVQKHSDFDAIMASDSYWKWAEEQKPGLKFMAMNSPDPDDIIQAVSEFKKSKYAKEVSSLKDKEEEQRQKRIRDAQALRGGSRGMQSAKDKGGDPNDYDGAWNEADDILKKQGVV